MSIVLFLGAGYSAPFDRPTMNQFMNHALKRLSSDDQLFLIELVLDARQANSMLESSPTNLEDILSFAVMGDRLRLFGNHDGPRAPRLKRILQKIYSEVPNDQIEKYWNKYHGKLSKLLGYNDAQDFKSLSVITTNYDLEIESTLVEHRVRASLPFEFTETFSPNRDNRLILYNESGVPLFKLHGSVNWFEHDDGSTEVVGSVENTRFGSIPYVCLSNYKNEGSPLIVPPTFLKPDISGALLKVWEGAAKALNTAETVIFVGYSFPHSDVEMRYLLARSLSDNGRLQRIIICDRIANDIVSQLQEVNSGFGSHFTSFLDPHQGDWTQISLFENGSRSWRDARPFYLW